MQPLHAILAPFPIFFLNHLTDPSQPLQKKFAQWANAGCHAELICSRHTEHTNTLGSSSGTGVAIASGLCLGGLGTDTGISIRGPAGWLGLVGVRPSYGRVSVRGVFPRAYSFDTVGPIAHTVADAAALLQAIAKYDEKDKYAVRAPRQTSPPN